MVVDRYSDLIRSYKDYDFRYLCNGLRSRCIGLKKSLVVCKLFMLLANCFCHEANDYKDKRGRSHFIFNPLDEGHEMITLVAELYRNKSKKYKNTSAKLNKCLDNTDLKSIDGLIDLNKEITKQYGIDIIRMYNKSPRKKMLENLVG